MAADDDRPDPPTPAPPSLAPPGLGLGKLRRRRKPVEEAVEAPQPVEVQEPVEAPAPIEPAAVEPVAVEPAADDAPPLPVDFDPPADPTIAADDPADDEARETEVAARSFTVPGRVSAILVGLVVGALLVVATAGAGQACDSTSSGSCGGIGVVLLAAIVIVAILAGTLLLRMLKVPDPGSTSFLAVGLTVVVALLFFVHELTEWWMIIVVPAVSVVTYLASHWVTETYADVRFD